MMNELSELLHMVVDNNQLAFSRLVDMYWAKVYYHALSYSKSAERAQEITQDVFLRVWNKRELLTEVHDFEGFLFILSKNQIIASMRRNLEALSSNLECPEIEELTLLPHLELEEKELYEKIMSGIDLLPPSRRQVFVLSRLEGLTYDEIAAKLKISRNTVKEHIVRALNFLRSYMNSCSEVLLLMCFFTFI